MHFVFVVSALKYKDVRKWIGAFVKEPNKLPYSMWPGGVPYDKTGTNLHQPHTLTISLDKQHQYLGKEQESFQ